MRKLLLAIIVLLTSINLFALSFSYVEYIEVTRSEPVYRTITKRIPYQECWDEEVPVEYEIDGDGNIVEDNIGALIGGVAGGIIGHQIGKGSGKTAATVGGAIVGTIVGKNLSKKDTRFERGYKRVRRCQTRYEEHEERVQRGYKNYAFYNGREIVKFSKRPLKRIKIDVTVSY